MLSNIVLVSILTLRLLNGLNVVCWVSSAVPFKMSLANSEVYDQSALLGAVSSGSILFACMLK